MEMQVWRISVGMLGISLEMKNMWGIREAIQGIDGNLSIAVEITCNRNGNYKFKEWRDVKIIESKNTCKNLISHI